MTRVLETRGFKVQDGGGAALRGEGEKTGPGAWGFAPESKEAQEKVPGRWQGQSGRRLVDLMLYRAGN